MATDFQAENEAFDRLKPHLTGAEGKWLELQPVS